MRRSINLADLRSDEGALQSLMQGIKEAQPKKKKKNNKAKKKEAAQQSVVLVETPEEPVSKPPIAAIATKVYYDDDTLDKHNAIKKLISLAEGYFYQAKPVYASMEVLLSSAYRLSDTKNRILLASARQLCKSAEQVIAQKEKTRERLKKKKASPSDIKKALAAHSTNEIFGKLQAIFIELKSNLEQDTQQRQGKSYDDVHHSYHVDLSSADTQFDNVVLHRADLMITVMQPIDIKEAKRVAPNTDFIHVEGPIYAIKNALIIGFSPFALPKKVNEDSLAAAMAAHGFRATPVAKQMRHKTSNKIWFFVPEYSKILTKTISFADRSLNSEFETFKTLSNNPTPDDIRFIFMQLGITEEHITSIITRWQAVDTHRARLSLLHNEYQTVKRAMKNARLRLLREEFMNQNFDSITVLEKMKDRIVQIDEAKVDLKNEFSTLASKTGRADQGLNIGQYNRLDEAFEDIENKAVRNNPDTIDRVNIRKHIRNDKLKCRELRFEYTYMTLESRSLNSRIKATNAEIERRRQKAYEESSGA